MEDKVLAGLIPASLSNRDDVLTAKRNLLSCMAKNITFKSEIAKLIYSVLVAYFKATQGFPDSDMFSDILQQNQVDPELLPKALIKYESLTREVLPQDKFTFYLDKMSNDLEKESFEETLVQALDTLKDGDNIEEGITSLDKAKSLIIPKLFDSAMINQDTPHGDITNEKDELMAEYEEAKRTHGVVDGIKTGFKKIDDSIDAMTKGMLIVIAGASGEGKSWMAANIAVNVATKQKKNVVIITAETLRTQYRRRVVICHSNNPKFGGPLELNRVKNGLLSEEEEERYQMIVDDITSGQYGHIEISQVSNGTTLGDIRVYLEKLQLTMNIDLVIIDYLTLLKPSERTAGGREEAVALFKEAKQVAITFNKGTGVPIIALHQISFQARDKVKFAPGKFYTLASLADSSEAGKSADAAVAILRTEEMEQEHELGCGILKMRDSAPDDKLFKLFESYGTAYIADLEE